MKKAVRSALCLAGTMIILAVFYLADGAYFLGIVQVVIYTGAIIMLFLFVVMLVGVTAADSLKETIKGRAGWPLLCGLGFAPAALRGDRERLGEQSSTGSARRTPSGNVEDLARLSSSPSTSSPSSSPAPCSSRPTIRRDDAGPGRSAASAPRPSASGPTSSAARFVTCRRCPPCLRPPQAHQHQ